MTKRGNKVVQAEQILERLAGNEDKARRLEKIAPEKAKSFRDFSQETIYPCLIEVAKAGNEIASRAATMIGRR